MDCDRFDVRWVVLSFLQIGKSNPDVDISTLTPLTWTLSTEAVSCSQDMATSYENSTTEVLNVAWPIFVDEGDHEGKLARLRLLAAKYERL